MSKSKAKRQAEAQYEADEIIDTLAKLESLLANAGEATLRILRPKLMAIQAVQWHGLETEEPKNNHRWWSLNTINLIDVIRSTYFGPDGLDWSEQDVRDMFSKKAEAVAMNALNDGGDSNLAQFSNDNG